MIEEGRQLQDACRKAAKASEVLELHARKDKEAEQNVKNFLAAEKMRIRSDHNGAKIAEATLETMVMASQVWVDFINEMNQVRRSAEIARIRYENAKREWETARTLLSFQKEVVKRTS